MPHLHFEVTTSADRCWRVRECPYLIDHYRIWTQEKDLGTLGPQSFHWMECWSTSVGDQCPSLGDRRTVVINWVLLRYGSGAP